MLVDIIITMQGFSSFTLLIYCISGSGNLIGTELVISSNPVGASYCHGIAGQYVHSTGNVVELNHGDVVYIRTHPGNSISIQIWTDYDAKAEFIGWKLI
jgi:hypothetical protein